MFDVDVEVAHCRHYPRGFVHRPAGVGIGHENVARLEHGTTGPDARNVVVRVPAHLELKLAVAGLPVGGDVAGHLVGRKLRYGAVQHNVSLLAATEQFVKWKICDFAQNIPASHIDRCLHVGMAAQHRVHVAVEHAQIEWVEAYHLGPDLRKPGAHASRIGRQIGRTQGAALGVTGDTGVGLNRNHGRVENLDEVAI